MTNESTIKVAYRGENEDFVIFVESAAALAKYRKDPSTPLVDVLDSYKIFVTHKHGAQGVLDTASKAQLDSNFASASEDEVLKTILEEGKISGEGDVKKFGKEDPITT